MDLIIHTENETWLLITTPQNNIIHTEDLLVGLVVFSHGWFDQPSFGYVSSRLLFPAKQDKASTIFRH
jgi:hypothetical protein